MKTFVKGTGVCCFLMLLVNTLLAQVQSRDTIPQDTVKKAVWSIRGSIVGGEKKELLPGAYIYIGEEKMPIGTTDTDGRFIIKNLPAGKVELSVSYIGYETFSAVFDLGKDLDVGEICLQSVLLDEVVVEAKVPLAVQYGDTTKFNANALKVAVDGDLEDLIKKLPGFEIVDGKIMAQGKEVTHLYIDGIEYSFNNPAAALKNLPAKLVNKIAMYDKLSDEAEFSGYDDGKRYRSLNIETRDPNKPKLFGRAAAAYGLTSPLKNTFSENNYKGYLMGNYFDRKNKITLDGNATNLGQRIDLPGSRFGLEDGYNRMESMYVNISSVINEKLTLSTNYRWSGNESSSASKSKQEYFPTDHYESRMYDSENQSQRNGTDNSLNARVEYTLNKKNRFVFTPTLSVGRTDSRMLSYTGNVEDGDTVNVSNALNRNDANTLNLKGEVLWMHAFAKKGRTFTLNLSGGYRHNLSNQLQNNEEHSLEESGFYQDTIRNFLIKDNQKSYDLSVSANWAEPLTANARLSLNYTYQENMSRSDKNSESFSDKDFKHLLGIDTAQTNDLKNAYRVHNYGARYNYRQKKFRFSGGLSLSNTCMDNRYRYLGQGDSILVSRYTDFSPVVNFGYECNKNSNLDFMYSGNSSSPSVTQLQDVLTVNNPLQVSKGNLDLKKSFSHNGGLNYVASQPEKSIFFQASLRAGQTFNQISSNVQFIDRDTVINGYALARGASLTMPVNLNGSWNIGGSMSYSFPWEKMKLRFNTSLGYNFSRTPSIYDGLKNMNTSHASNLGLTLITNFSEDFDCTLSSNNTLSWSENTKTGNSRYYNSNLNCTLNWVIWKGFYVDMMYTGSFNLTKKADRVKQTEHVLNAEIGKKFGKERRLSLSLSSRDILQNRRTMTYSVTDLYTSTSYSTVPSTCFLLSLSYRFDNMGR